MEDEVQLALRELGVNRFYRGFRSTVTAVSLALEDENRLENVVVGIYQEIASRDGTNWTAVERNLRTVVNRAWQINPQRLIEMAGYPLVQPPTASEFIEILFNYVSRNTVTK